MDRLKGAIKGLIISILTKAVTSPTGLAILGTVLILMLAGIFLFFPKGEGFDKDNPDANKNILNDDSEAFVTCQKDEEINMEQFTEMFDGAGLFDGKSDVFIDVSKDNKLDPILFAAIAIHETGWGNSTLVKKYNNPGGLYNSKTNDFYHFDTLKAGLDMMASNLYDNYYAEGLFMIKEIGQKYAPIGVANDPTNLNAHWIPTITKFANQMGGLTMHCKVSQSEKGFVIPVKKPYTVTSEYGSRIDPLDGSAAFHQGMDFDCAKPDSIFAARKGKVVFAQYTAGYGNMVIIKHSNQVYSGYGHMSKLIVSSGDKVNTKQQIGVCGTTGDSTGTHLHFEIQLGGMFGTRINPRQYLPLSKEGN